MSTLALPPPELAGLLLLLGGLAMVCQARRLGLGLVGLGVASLLLTPLLKPILALFPIWLVLAVGAVLSLLVLRGLLQLAAGRAGGEHAMGILASDLIRFLVLLPFRAVGGLLALFFRRGGP